MISGTLILRDSNLSIKQLREIYIKITLPTNNSTLVRRRRHFCMKKPLVGIIMGSDSDLSVMQDAATVLDEFGVDFESTIVSAHRTPKRLTDYADAAQERGLKIIIAGAGGAAHLPGMVAAHTTLPVIGVPIMTKTMGGLDSLLSIAQMPPGVPGRDRRARTARRMRVSLPPRSSALRTRRSVRKFRPTRKRMRNERAREGQEAREGRIITDTRYERKREKRVRQSGG